LTKRVAAPVTPAPIQALNDAGFGAPAAAASARQTLSPAATPSAPPAWVQVDRWPLPVAVVTKASRAQRCACRAGPGPACRQYSRRFGIAQVGSTESVQLTVVRPLLPKVTAPAAWVSVQSAHSAPAASPSALVPVGTGSQEFDAGWPNSV
jgi:hypothetical protein